MHVPGIEVVLACPCMTTDGSRIDWIPGEYVAISPEEAATLLAQHLTTPHHKENTP